MGRLGSERLMIAAIWRLEKPTTQDGMLRNGPNMLEINERSCRPKQKEAFKPSP